MESNLCSLIGQNGFNFDWVRTCCVVNNVFWKSHRYRSTNLLDTPFVGLAKLAVVKTLPVAVTPALSPGQVARCSEQVSIHIKAIAGPCHKLGHRCDTWSAKWWSEVATGTGRNCKCEAKVMAKMFFFFHYRWPDSRFNWSGAPWRISYFLFRAWQQLCHTNWHTHHCSWSASAAHFVNKSRRIKIENLWHDDIRKSCATAADWKLVNTKGKALEFFNIPRSIKCQGSTGSISVCFPF